MKFRTLALAGASALALMTSGCGSGGASPSPSANVPTLPFGSPVLAGSTVIPSHYKCNSRHVWLPLQWGEPPAETRELAMYIARFSPPKVVRGRLKAEIKASAIVVGIKPTLRKLSLGKYPSGVLIGVHAPKDLNASICPPRGTRQSLMFRIFALPHKLGVSKSSRNVSETLVSAMTKQATEVGTFIVSYKPT